MLTRIVNIKIPKEELRNRESFSIVSKNGTLVIPNVANHKKNAEKREALLLIRFMVVSIVRYVVQNFVSSTIIAL